MHTPPSANALLDQTIAAFNGESQTVSPLDGLMLIDNWLLALPADLATAGPVRTSLSALKHELQRGNPNGDQIVGLLNDLADQSRQATTTADDHARPGLRQVAESLTAFARHLHGHAPTPTDDNAPGAATIGAASV
jgi:hypothetical protein